MKRILVIIMFVMKVIVVHAQSQEAQQLLLDWEKLTQFKTILQNMYDGYKIIHKGYTTIKDISKGNFSLHKTFLDALMEVSPVVKKYRRIGDIVTYQIRMLKEGKMAFNRFKQDKNFTEEEINFIGKVYGNLFDQSIKNLDELLIVITAGELRMSDDERLHAVDRIYGSIVDQFSFLREFNNTTGLLALTRSSEKNELDMSRKIYGH